MPWSEHPRITYPDGFSTDPAIERFLAEDDRFAVDESMHKFFFTFNPRGYLKRVH